MQLHVERHGQVIYLPQPGESKSQYVPHVIQLPSGDLWMVVKGDESREIRGYLSTNGGETFVFEGSVIRPTIGSWDSNYCIDPAMILDPTEGKIHYYWKGNTVPGYGGMGIGHAWAPASDPTNVTKTPEPLLTAETARVALGLTELRDLYVSDVMRDPWNVLTFWGGFCGPHGTPYRILRFRSLGWDAPLVIQPIGGLSPATPHDFIQAPCVFKDGNNYVMTFTEGTDSGAVGVLRQNSVRCLDDGNWQWSPTGAAFLPNGGPLDWDSKQAYCLSILKGGPKHDMPLTINGTQQWFYSGSPLCAPNTATSGRATARQVEVVEL